MVKSSLYIGNWERVILCLIFALLTITSYQLSIIPVNAQCQTNNRSDSLVSTPDLTYSNPNSKFGSSSGTCVTNSGTGVNYSAALPSFQIPSYDTLRSQFFDQTIVGVSNYPCKGVSPNTNPPCQYKREVGTAGTTISSVSEINSDLASQDTLIHYLGNLDITSSITGSYSGVIFIDGSLYIDNDITYGTATTGLVFIVKGDIMIDSSVHSVNAVLMSTGTICTSSLSQTCPTGIDQATVSSAPLIVNGNLVSLNSNFPIRFRRNLQDNSIAAEQINNQPKYLVLLAHAASGLQNLLASTLVLTTEDTSYAINFPSSNSVSLTGPNTTVYTGASYTLSWTSSQGTTSCSSSTTGPANTWNASNLLPNDSTSISPTLPGTYIHTIKCIDAQGIYSSSSKSINVVYPPAQVSFNPSSQYITTGNSFSFSYTISNASSNPCSASVTKDGAAFSDPNWPASIPSTSGSATTSEAIAGTYQFNLTCTNLGGVPSTPGTATVYVVPPPSITLTAAAGDEPVSTPFTLNTTISNASPTPCSASVTKDGISFSDSNWQGSISSSSQSYLINESLAGTYVYSLTCANLANTQFTGSTTVKVWNPPTVKLTVNGLTTSPTAVPLNSQYTLATTITNAQNCSGTTSPTNGGNNWSSSQTTNSSSPWIISNSGSYTHTLTCSNPAFSPGPVTSITVVTPPIHDQSVNIASSGTVSTLTLPSLSIASNRSTNGLILIGVSIQSSTGQGVNSIVDNGTTYTSTNNLVNSFTTGSGTTATRIELWKIMNPASGNHTIVVNLTAAASVVAGAQHFYNVNQTSPLGSFTSASGSNSTAPSITINSDPKQLVTDLLAANPGNSSALTATPASGQNQRWSLNGTCTSGCASFVTILGASSNKNGASSVATSWTLNRVSTWLLGAVSIQSP